MIELYHNDMSVCAQKARFALAEKSHCLSLSETRHQHGRAGKVSPEDARPGKRERSWENVTKGIDSRYFPESIKRFDKLLGDMEVALSESPWLTGKEFSLPDIGYAPYITRLDHLQLQFLWDERPHIPAWYDRLLERRGYKEGLEDWFNASYLSLMKEKGAEVQSQVRAIVASV